MQYRLIVHHLTLSLSASLLSCTSRSCGCTRCSRLLNLDDRFRITNDLECQTANMNQFFFVPHPFTRGFGGGSTYEITNGDDSFLCDCGYGSVLDYVFLYLTVQPTERLTSRRREVVSQTKEVTKDQRSKEPEDFDVVRERCQNERERRKKEGGLASFGM